MIAASTIVLILAAVMCSSLGQLLLKSGVQHLGPLGGLPFLLGAAREVRVLSGVLAWIASTICWLYVLRVAPLSKAYLFGSLTYVVVPLASVYVFGEQLRRLHIVAMTLIVAGVFCLLAGK